MKPVVILQTSPIRTGSTLLTNLVYGFLCYHRSVSGFWSLDQSFQIDPTVTIFKTHILDLDKLAQVFSAYDVYFVCSFRDQKRIPIEYYPDLNIIVFDYYCDLLETPSNPLPAIVANVFTKLQPFLPSHLVMSKKNALKRIHEMNHQNEIMKNMPFGYINRHYELHGSHRDRNRWQNKK